VTEKGISKSDVGFEGLMIYLNDFNEIINIYEDFFQGYVITKVSESEKDEEKRTMAKERCNTILYSTYKEILAWRQSMINKLPRYVLIHDLERDDFLFLFTQKWENQKGDNIISNVLATIMDYIREIQACLKDENNTSILKSITSTFVSTMLSEAYFLKLLMSINKKNKLKLDLPKDTYIESLLPYVYQETLTKKQDAMRIRKQSN
jgi:hypothetical protein